ncbi:hypothetical protein [uncultured Desulfosarcina sp.]|uniref:RNA recognition motif domain-containing protein n=1 Tax=uncultured Desulfosarcina sp. TaxID=218289 RepID=UPI0029C79FC5|nr:hypothetical protein [uncultured Desulfosarcina sp.]
MWSEFDFLRVASDVSIRVAGGVTGLFAERISSGMQTHYSSVTTARNAKEFVEYLLASSTELLSAPNVFLEKGITKVLNILHEAEAGVAAAEVTLPECIYVGNLPFDATENDLKSLFEKKNVQIKSISMPKKYESGENKGFAFIELSTKGESLLAFDLDGLLTLGGRRLRINEANSFEANSIQSSGHERPSPPLSKSVYVGNLSFKANEANIRELLAAHDITTVDIFIMKDKKTGISKGAGFINLRSKDEAVKVIGALNGIEFMGRKLIAKPANLRRGR